ncbi:MAG: TIGR04255 family protein [Candidatus Hodarchaeales archaeon]
MVETDKYLDRSFKNPFLSSVAFEIRFPSLVSILTEFSKFQELFTEDYPNYSEEFPMNFPEQAIAPSSNFRRIVLLDQNETNVIKVSLNTLSFISKDYEKFEYFKNKVTDIVDKFIEVYSIKKATRFGLRYVNRYPINKPLEITRNELKELFVPPFNPELYDFTNILELKFEARKEYEDSVITTKTSLVKEKEENYVYILDFDAYKMEFNEISEYKEIVDNLRIYEKKQFLEVVTENFMEKMQFLD